MKCAAERMPVSAPFSNAYFNYVGAAALMDRLAEETLLMQGPSGSMLMQDADAARVPSAFWNVAEPQTVEHLHALYAAAGAQVLITNTFQASGPALERDGITQTVAEVNRAGVACARAAHPEHVVGSIGPCGVDWFHEDDAAFRQARAAYRDQAWSLLAAGVDALLLETFTSVRAATPALAGALDVAAGMPIFLSFVIDNEGCLVGDGLTCEGAVVWAEKHGADAVGVNCCSLAAAGAAVPRMAHAARTPVMVRPHGGLPAIAEDGTPVWSEDVDAFAQACQAWRADGARMLGGCCGTTPATVAAMADALY